MSPGMTALLCTASLAHSSSAAAVAANRTQAQPNVLFIVVDDLGVTSSNYGFPAVAPNLERLAARGTQFSRAFVSIAVCAPSRTAFLTGMRPDTTQVWTIDPYFRHSARGGLGMAITTLPQLFRAHGYRTTGAGKIFHPGTASGGVSGSEGGGDMCPADSPTNNCSRVGAPVGSWSEPYWFCDHYTNDTVQSPAMQRWPCAHGAWPSCGTGCVQSDACVACFERAHTWGVNGIAWAAADCDDACYPEGLIADQAIATLRSYAGARAAHRAGRVTAAVAANAANTAAAASRVEVAAAPAPFFLAVGFKRPHLTYKAPSRFFDMYPLDSIALPLHAGPSPSWPAIAAAHSCVAGNELVAPFGVNRTCRVDGMCSELVTNTTVVRELRRAYYAVTTFMDSQLGRVLDALNETGLAEDTIVTFIGDHGYQNGEKGQWCKSNNFELATRVPMLIAPAGAWAADTDESGAGRRQREPHRGAVSAGIVETIDLLPTLADLAGLQLPAGQLSPGQSLAPVLLQSEGTGDGVGGVALPKAYAMSQWPRRPSCLYKHDCLDGHGDPSSPANDTALMGYTLRTSAWRYSAWFAFDFGAPGASPTGASAPGPVWEHVVARELYDHRGDTMGVVDAEAREWDNLAADAAHASTVAALHAQLLGVIKASLANPTTAAP